LLGFLGALTIACGPGEQPRPGAGARPADATAARTTDATDPESPPAKDPRPAVVFLGTSLTAGLGVPSDEAYPALLQERIDRAGLAFRVINAGVSGDTSAGGLRRIEWLLREPLRVLVLELGANDMLRGQDIAALRSNLQQIVDRTRARYPDARIVVVGMQSAPNLGEPYGREFARTFEELAQRNGAALVPFLLDGVAAVPGLNQADGMHPTAEGHRVLAENVWKVLEPVLQEIGAAAAN
jgi:acyl-CoA thioesterase-1